MKSFLVSFILLALGCNQPAIKNKKKILPKIETTKPVPKEEVIVKKEVKIPLKEILVTINDLNKIKDAKKLVENNGLIWNKTIINSAVLKVASIKIPIDKIDFWTQRLKENNIFSSVQTYSNIALENLKLVAKNTFIKVKKNKCSGDCPVYDVVFFKDRNVNFNGVENVLVKGKKKFTITEKQYKKLSEMFRKTSFKDYNTGFISKSLIDFPSTYITHQNKQVEIKLWRNVPDELAYAYEYLEGILLEKKLIE